MKDFELMNLMGNMDGLRGQQRATIFGNRQRFVGGIKLPKPAPVMRLFWLVMALMLGWTPQLVHAGPLSQAWQRSEPFANSGSLAVDGEGSVVITAYDENSALVIKFSATGQVLWRDRFGTKLATFTQRALADTAGHIWVTGSDRTGVPHLFARKYHSDGTLLWEQSFTNAGLPEAVGPSRILDGMGNLIMAGIIRGSNNIAPQDEYIIVKYSPAGSELWTRRQPVPDGHYAGSANLALTGAGDVVLSGYAYGPGGISEFITSQYSTAGVLLWTAQDGWHALSNFTTDVAVDAGGNIYVVGNSYVDSRNVARIVKYSANGSFVWTRTLPAERYYETIGRNVVVDSESHVIVTAGEFLPSPSDSDDFGLANTLLVGFDGAGEELWIARTLDNIPIALALGNGVYFQMDGPWQEPSSPRVRTYSTQGQRLAELSLTDYAITDVKTDPAGNLFVLGLNQAGLSLHKLTLAAYNQLPAATIDPPLAEIGFGTGALFQSQVIGLAPIHYQWLSYGIPIPHETNSSLVIKPVLIPNFRSNYSLQVSNSAGATLSTEVRLRVRMLPTFTTTGQTNELSAGRPLNWFSEGAGEPPLALQWWFGARPLAGQTNRYFELSGVSPADAGSYTLVASNAWGVVTNGPFVLKVATNTPFDEWRWRNPLPQGNDLFGAAYGNGRFVAVGTHGALIVSADGLHWKSQNEERFGQLIDVHFAEGRFVAVGALGKILVSVDGLNWESRGSPSYLNLVGVTYGNGTWLIVGDTFLTSTNGIDWLAAPPNGHSASDVAYGAGRFVVCNQGRGPSAITSIDGHNWEPINFNGVAPTTSGRARVSFGEARFVIVSNADSLVSTNGVNWRAADPDTSRRFNDVAIGPGIFVAVGTSGRGTDAERSRVFSSTDSIHWTTNDVVLSNNLHRVARLPDRFVALGDDGNLLTSPDGIEWTTITYGSDVNLASVASGAGRLVAVGDDGHVLVSNPDSSWVRVPSGSTNKLMAVTYGLERFVAVGEEGNVQVSSDGSVWTRTFVAKYPLLNVIYAGQRFVAVGNNGTIITSIDALDWTPRVSGTSNHLRAVAYGSGKYVVGSSIAEILTSPDGVTWTARNIHETGYFRGLAYGNGTFLAVGSFFGPGQLNVASSVDGVEWMVYHGPEDFPSGDIFFLNGQFLVPGIESRVHTSFDGKSWLQHYTPTQNELNGFALSAGGTVVAVGNNHTIIESRPLLPTVEWAGVQSDTLQLILSGWPGRPYRLQASPDLNIAAWTDVLDLTVPWPQTNMTIELTAARQFYRLRPP